MMSSIGEKWNALSFRQKLLCVVAAAMACIIAVKYANVDSGALPLDTTLERRMDALKSERARLVKMRRRQDRRMNELAELKRQITPYIWRMNTGLPATEVQSEIEKIARSAHTTIQTMGSPRTTDVGDRLRAVEISVSLTGSMREISRFLYGLHVSGRRFYWDSCRIRPTNLNDISSLNLSGALKAYYTIPELEENIFDSEAKK